MTSMSVGSGLPIFMKTILAKGEKGPSSAPCVGKFVGLKAF